MLKSRITYSIFTFSTLCFVYFYGGIVPWAFFISALVFPIVSFTYLLISYFSLKYFETFRPGVYIKGEEINYSCQFSNELFVPFVYLRIHIKTPETMVTGLDDIKDVSLAGGRKLLFAYNIECKYRGRYEVGITKIEFVDFLNIFKLKLIENKVNSVTIFPRIKMTQEFLGDGMAPSDYRLALLRRGREDDSIISLREYAYGDSSRLIHWKLTARMQKLVVMDRESGFDNKVSIILDLSKTELEKSKTVVLEDRLIEDLIAVTNFFINKNIPVNLIYYKNSLIIDRVASKQDFDQMHKLMAEIQFDSDLEIEKLLQEALAGSNSKNSLFIFTKKLSRELYLAVRKMGRVDRKVYLRYCALEEQDREVYNYHRMIEKQVININLLKEEQQLEKINEKK